MCMSEILESVLQKQLTYRQYHYILIQMTMCNIHMLSTHSVLLDILTVINTHYTPYVHILHYVHIYTHTVICKGAVDLAVFHKLGLMIGPIALHLHFRSLHLMFRQTAKFIHPLKVKNLDPR